MEINNFKIEVSKNLPAAIEKVYKAWTSANELKQWWKPINNTLVTVKNDLKEGGVVEYIFRDNDLVISGEYLEVKENEKLVYTWNWEFPKEEIRNAAYKLSVKFQSNDDSCTIHITQENFQNEEGILPHKQGWEKGLNDLEEYLQRNNNS